MTERAASPFPIPTIDCLNSDYRQQLARDVREGLGSFPKSLPSKYFYDERGSELFEEICAQPEYYPTRCELEALQRLAPELVRDMSGTDIIELGSGANRKIKALLDVADRSLREAMRYVPVDVCGDYLQAAARDLRRHFPELSVLGVVADFTRHLQALPNTRQRLFLFLGGTLGNFADDEALEFLTRVSRSMHSGDHFILGLDMAKSRTVLERAYNDARGVTAAFNKNILRVVNNELNATFDPDLFEHRAFFNPQKSRVEMHLEALRDMEVEVADLPLRVPLARGETIHTEISRKFAPEEIETMASRAGLRIHRWTSDREGMFSLLDLVV